MASREPRPQRDGTVGGCRGHCLACATGFVRRLATRIQPPAAAQPRHPSSNPNDTLITPGTEKRGQVNFHPHLPGRRRQWSVLLPSDESLRYSQPILRVGKNKGPKKTKETERGRESYFKIWCDLSLAAPGGAIAASPRPEKTPDPRCHALGKYTLTYLGRQSHILPCHLQATEYFFFGR
jgi:hypothetical protein